MKYTSQAKLLYKINSETLNAIIQYDTCGKWFEAFFYNISETYSKFLFWDFFPNSEVVTYF